MATRSYQRPDPAEAQDGRRSLLRKASIILWAAVLVVQGVNVALNPSAFNTFVTAAFVALCLMVNAQLFLVRWMGERNWNRVMSRMYRSSYVSELHNLPNRNYLLAELRREMPRARTNGVPFTLVMASLDNLEEIRGRRGDAFCERSAIALADVLRRITRNADFIAHLQGGQFCVMLNECSADDAWAFLRTVPGVVSISDGRQMYDAPVNARMLQYDMESLYATDVLRDVEEAEPLYRYEEPRFGSEAA